MEGNLPNIKLGRKGSPSNIILYYIEGNLSIINPSMNGVIFLV